MLACQQRTFIMHNESTFNYACPHIQLPLLVSLHRSGEQGVSKERGRILVLSSN